MCSRIRTLSAKIFRASRSCCTASPWMTPSFLLWPVIKNKTKQRDLPCNVSYLTQARPRLSLLPQWSLWVKKVMLSLQVGDLRFTIHINHKLTGRPCSPLAPGGPYKSNNIRVNHISKNWILYPRELICFFTTSPNSNHTWREKGSCLKTGNPLETWLQRGPNMAALICEVCMWMRGRTGLVTGWRESLKKSWFPFDMSKSARQGHL